MTPIRSRDKGNAFERAVVEVLNEKVKRSRFKRIAGSGAIGTTMHEPLLTGDISGKIEGFPRSLKIECKVGYGGEKQLTLQREWLNKIKKEAQDGYAFPVLIGKFSGARKADGVQIFSVLDIEDLVYLLNLISDLNYELELLHKE